MDRGISKPHTQLSTHASKLWKPNPRLKTVAGEASELLLLLTVHLGLDHHIRTAGFGDSKDTVDPQCLLCLSAELLSLLSSPSHSGSTRRQGNYSGPSLPGLAGKEELLVTAW